MSNPMKIVCIVRVDQYNAIDAWSLANFKQMI